MVPSPHPYPPHPARRLVSGRVICRVGHVSRSVPNQCISLQGLLWLPTPATCDKLQPTQLLPPLYSRRCFCKPLWPALPCILLSFASSRIRATRCPHCDNSSLSPLRNPFFVLRFFKLPHPLSNFGSNHTCTNISSPPITTYLPTYLDVAMQRRPSFTERLRKVSDPLIQMIVPSSSSSRIHGQDSFFEYGKKGWHAPRPRPPDSFLRHRPVRRKVSKEEIRYPLLHPEDTLDLWIESATMSAERERSQSRARTAPSTPNHTSSIASHDHGPPSRSQSARESTARPERPARPSLDERPLVVRDPQLRAAEQRVYRSVNTAKRPERPNEEDLPYGARGSIPKAFMPKQRPPPPAAAVRASLDGDSERARARGSSIPFPEQPSNRTQTQPQAQTRSQPVRRDEGPSRGREPAQKQKIFSPFAPISTSVRGTAGVAVSSPVIPGPTPPPKDAKWVTADVHLTLTSTSGARRLRRTSSSGDANLPNQHSRYDHRHQPQPQQPQVPPQPRPRPERGDLLRMRDENEPRRARPQAPELRTVKSTPLSSRQPSLTGTGPSLPAHPAVHLERTKSRTLKPPQPDVPQDVSPIDPPPIQRLPAAAVRGAHSQRERVKEALSARPVPVQAAVQHEHIRSVSYTAQVVSPTATPDRTRDREREPRPDRERERRRRREREGRERTEREVQFYGKADTFAHQIALALAEPERATPLPIDWDMFMSGGNGTKPLVTRKHKDREESHHRAKHH
ncbi:hypothetical protein C8Q74DRAFT_721128 [Fomes fomentarius]|nr:hypothetical protein C8Q74DRAFT_721128 [Fomes fomentarius]